MSAGWVNYLTHPWVNFMIGDSRPVNPSTRTLVLIAKGYGIPLEELLRMATCEGAEESADLEAVARSLQTLEPEDREVILYLIKRLHGG